MDALLHMQWDDQFLLFLQENVRNDVLTPIMKFITHLGDKGILWILIAVLLCCFKKTRPIGIMAGIALAMSVIINNAILKNLVARPRPYLPETVGGQGLKLLIEEQGDWSFPSGHSGASFAAAVVFTVEAAVVCAGFAAVVEALFSLVLTAVVETADISPVCAALNTELVEAF